eukprot:1152697-Pelagomonas_calceolata.AAC.2
MMQEHKSIQQELTTWPTLLDLLPEFGGYDHKADVRLPQSLGLEYVGSDGPNLAIWGGGLSQEFF